MELYNINKMMDDAYNNSCRHGWHSDRKSNEHFIMMVITELSEAIECDRKDKHADAFKFDSEVNKIKDKDESKYIECFNKYMKNTVEEELADVMIRLFDLSRLIGVNVPGDTFNDENLYTSKIMSSLKNKTFTEFSYTVSEILCNSVIDVKYRIIDSMVNVFCKSSLMGFNLQYCIESKIKYNSMVGCSCKKY